MAKRIKIGIDYHGVITANPEFFRDFNRLAIEKGCEIYVLSGGSGADIKKFLQSHEIAYSTVWSMLDYFANQNMVSYLPDGSFQVQDDLWNDAKAKYCLDNGIDFHIDDSALYGQTFETPFCLYDERNKTCSVGKHYQCFIDFHLPPAEVLEQILLFLQQC